MKTDIKMKNSVKTENFPFKSLKSLKFLLAFAIAICLLSSASLSTNDRNLAANAETNANDTNDTLKIVSVGFVSDNDGEFRIKTDDFNSDAEFFKTENLILKTDGIETAYSGITVKEDEKRCISFKADGITAETSENILPKVEIIFKKGFAVSESGKTLCNDITFKPKSESFKGVWTNTADFFPTINEVNIDFKDYFKAFSIGSTNEITITTVPSEKSYDFSATLRSSDENIAKIKSPTEFEATGYGYATITAEVFGVVAKKNISVMPNAERDKLGVDGEENGNITVYRSDSLTLLDTLKVFVFDGSEKHYINVTAENIEGGTSLATLGTKSLKIKFYGLELALNVEIVKPENEIIHTKSLVASEEKIVMRVGDKTVLKVKTVPENADDKIAYEVNGECFTFDGETVTGVSAGKGSIILTSGKPSSEATLTVDISVYPEVVEEEIAVEYGENALTLTTDKDLGEDGVYSDEILELIRKSFTYGSAALKSAEILDGKVVLKFDGLSDGDYLEIAENSLIYGNFGDDGELAVIKIKGGIQIAVADGKLAKAIPYKDIEIESETVKCLLLHEANLGVTVVPQNANVGTLSFETSDESVATVNSKGYAAAVIRGKCVVTVTLTGYKDEVITKEINVEVYDEIVDITCEDELVAIIKSTNISLADMTFTITYKSGICISTKITDATLVCDTSKKGEVNGIIRFKEDGKDYEFVVPVYVKRKGCSSGLTPSVFLSGIIVAFAALIIAAKRKFGKI